MPELIPYLGAVCLCVRNGGCGAVRVSVYQAADARADGRIGRANAAGVFGYAVSSAGADQGLAIENSPRDHVNEGGLSKRYAMNDLSAQADQGDVMRRDPYQMTSTACFYPDLLP